MKHISGIYIQDEDITVYNTLMQLINLLEDLWVNRQTGEAKVEGLVRSMMPLAAWRIINNIDNENNNNNNSNNKRSTSVSTTTTTDYTDNSSSRKRNTTPRVKRQKKILM